METSRHSRAMRFLKWGLIIYFGAMCVLCAVCAGLVFTPNRKRSFNQRDVEFTISPDGQHIAFVAGPRHSHIYVMNLNTRHIKQVSPENMEACYPHFSPDGRLLLYAARKADSKSSTPYALYLYSLEHKTHRYLVGLPNRSLWGMFLPDGKHILCVQSQFKQDYTWGPIFAWMGAGYWKIEACHVAHLDGTLLHPLPTRRVVLGRPVAPSRSWVLGEMNVAYDWRDMVAGSPTIRQHRLPVPALDYSAEGQLVYIDTPPNRYEYDLWLYDMRTKRKEQLTFTRGYIGDAMFHPDGRRVLFLYGDWSGYDPRYSLWEVDIRTKQTRQIADPTLFDDPLRWHPP